MLALLVLLTVSRSTFGRDLDLNQCYRPYHTDVESEPLYKFKVPVGKKCRDYCLNLVDCKAFIFSLGSLVECALHRETPTVVLKYQRNKSSHAVGFKSCIKGIQNLNRTEVMRVSEREGVVIQRVDAGVVSCLVKGRSLNGKPGLSLFWNRMSKDCLVWTFTVRDDPVTEGFFRVKAKDKDSNMCLTVSSISNKEEPKAILMPCELQKVSPTSKSKRYVINELTLFEDNPNENRWTIACPNTRSMITASTQNVSRHRSRYYHLSTMRFTTEEDVMDLVCWNIMVVDGSVPLLNKVPFLFFGEIAQVVCDDGYARTTDNITFETEFTVVCARVMPPIVCSLIPGDLLGECASQIIKSHVLVRKNKAQ